MYFIAFYAPPADVEPIKQAMFAAGAGRIGDYAACAWQTLGTGQFMPLPAATPFIGTPNTLETVTECRVEMVCEEAYIEAAVHALRTTHPYETVAFQVIRLESF